MMNPNDTGGLGEAHFLAYCAVKGWEPYRGLGSTPCDFVVDTFERLIKVEVKCSVALLKSTHYMLCNVKPELFDFLFVSIPGYRYFIPAALVKTLGRGSKRGWYVRLAAPQRYDSRFGVYREYSEHLIWTEGAGYTQEVSSNDG